MLTGVCQLSACTLPAILTVARARLRVSALVVTRTRPEGKSAFADGRLFLMHLGAGSAVALSAPPPIVHGGPRVGGTDAANAATWRLTAAPVGVDSTAAGLPKKAGEWFFIESFDMPGFVLAPAKGGTTGSTVVGLALQRASGSEPMQLWHKELPPGDTGEWLLRNGGGGVLTAQKRAAPPTSFIGR